MREPVEKVDCFEHPFRVYMSSPSRPSAVLSPLLRFGALALVLAAVLLLCASVAALFFWKVTDKNVYNVRYSININGELREASTEIDSDNNLERFKPGDEAEALEIHDFQIGITGIRFFGGDKCYIKSQIKDDLPDVESDNRELLMPDPRDEILPVRSEEQILTWVAMDLPLKDNKFLSKKIISLCKGLPIYWLQPANPKDGVRRQRREAERETRQFNTRRSRPAAGEKRGTEEETPRAGAEQEDNGPQSAGSAFNPENPYHTESGGAREDGAMTFDPMLDHRGICCAECQRGYTHCQRICEPLYGHWPWPYHHRGCQVACRVIMPCRWWVARILGLV
ncbi:leukocyte cell-derived chemotaxin 1 isoform X2 [Eucyclogobius newberryi]|uniref:leukocyte cell-derived chemotaxin 1 isoform X2 n=1 Tax=Eucyclogobius newberryi TaxID=166745 RepID=UPI003B5B9221